MEQMLRRFRSSLLDSLCFCRDQLNAETRTAYPALYSDLCQIIDQQGTWSKKLGLAPRRISEALDIIYGRPAIVLIDEYDAPLDHALQNGYLSEASNFCAVMFSSLLKVSEFC
jgi:hypothetical protein